MRADEVRTRQTPTGGVDQKRVLRSIVSWYQEIWPALLPTASDRSAAPDCASCPGNPCIRSIFHRRKPAAATMSSARRASSPEWIRPKVSSARSSKLCTPMLSRFTPAPRYSAKRLLSALPGLLSSVISTSRESVVLFDTPSRSAPSQRPSNRLGVPPPIKIDSIGRSRHQACWLSRSARMAST